MNAQILLAKVEALGVALKADGDRLLYRPQDAVSPELMAELTGPQGRAPRAAERAGGGL